MKITLLITLLSLFSSCSKIVKKDIAIYPTIQKDDSILILNVKNNTESNLMIEFPVLDNFFYRDEFDSSNPEILMTKKSFNLLKDSADILKINTINCLTIKKIIQTNDTLDLKFLKAKSEKKYYLYVFKPT